MKKIISLLLCVVMIFSLSVPGLASEESEYKGNPLIVVRGFDMIGLHKEDGSPAINLELGDLLNVAKSFLFDFVIGRSSEAFLDNVMGAVENIFYAISMDEQGNPTQELYYDKYDGSMAENSDALAEFSDITEEGLVKTACDRIGSENVYFFTYDWRRSAKELAADLNSYIKSVLKEKGVKKVNIVAVSMGGMVTTSYLYHHGAGKIDNLTFLSSAHNGTYTCGDCYAGNICFDGDVLYNHIKRLMQGNIITDIFLSVFSSLGLFDSVAQMLNNVVEDTSYLLNGETMRSTLGSVLGLWAMCPDDTFDEAVEFIYGEHKDEYPAFLDKLAETRDFLFATESTLKKAVKKGAKLTFISNYGTPMAPYYKHSELVGDGVLETVLTSNFATVAPLGATLDDEYIAGIADKYISPDKTLDASTAKYKNQTWFVRNAGHVPTDYGSDFSEFVLWLALAREQPKVTTDKSYPRFMTLDAENNLIADKG